jgi:SAM-dependent methyltransferase
MPMHSGHMPPTPPRFSSSESHHARRMAESFGFDPERYERARPSYPQALADRILAASPGAHVLDVGIGTGISSRGFQAAGCRVLGVEVDTRMAAFARQRGLEVEVAKFEEWDSAGRVFDAVIAGQTWHWIDPVAGAAKAAEVLRPGGRLAVFWNVMQFPSDLSESFASVFQRVLPGSPFAAGMTGGVAAYSGQFTKAADGMREAGGFGEPEQWRHDWERSYPRDEWLDVIPTAGGFDQIPPGKLEEILAGVGAAIDARGGTFTMSYAAIVVTAARTDLA